MSLPETIEDIWAFIVTEPDGQEGIPAIGAPNGMMMPLVGADQERIESLRGEAEAMSRATGYPLKLVRFTKLNEESIEVE